MVPTPVPYANLANPQTLNLYAMVRDNPETFADLDGHDGEKDAVNEHRATDQVGGSGTNLNAADPVKPPPPPPQPQDKKPESPDLMKQVAAATAQKRSDSINKAAGPAVGSPEYVAKVSSEVSAEMHAGNKLIAVMAGIEVAGLAVVAVPEGLAVAKAGWEVAQVHPAQVLGFNQGVLTGMSPGASLPPPTTGGAIGYVVGRIIGSMLAK